MTKKALRDPVPRALPDIALALFALCLILFGALFTVNRNFWLDEYFSIELVKLDWWDIPAATAADVHPPLYYFILKFFLTLFGTDYIVYRIASFVPFVLMVAAALLLFRPAFGRFATLVFLCLMGLNDSTLRFFTEARMYGWAFFFVTLCGFSAYKIIDARHPLRRWWAAFTVCGLCSAYLHYFALLCVCFVYLFLLVYTLLRRRALLRGWGIAAAVSVVCYLPWVFMAIRNIVYQATGGFWLQELPALGETLELIVGGRLSSWVLLALLAAAIAVYLFFPDPESVRWLAATGLLGAVGVPAMGYLASVTLHPMYLSRYFFPVCGLLWLAMSIAASGLTRRLPWARVLLIAAILFTMCEPALLYYRDIREVNMYVEQSVDYVEQRIQPGDVIYSTADLVDTRVLGFLYPDQEVAAGADPAQAIPEGGGSLFLVYPEVDLPEDLVETYADAGLRVDGWQGALLNNQWCRIYYITSR